MQSNNNFTIIKASTITGAIAASTIIIAIILCAVRINYFSHFHFSFNFLQDSKVTQQQFPIGGNT